MKRFSGNSLGEAMTLATICILLINTPFIQLAEASSWEDDRSAIVETSGPMSQDESAERSTGACENVSLLGRWAVGPCIAVAVAGEIAYYGNGAYLQCSLPALSGLHGPIANRHFL